MRKIGIIGGGQLGRMAIEEAGKYLAEIEVLTPDYPGPASDLARVVHIGSLLDREAILEFASEVDVLSYEIEHVDVSALRELEASGRFEPVAGDRLAPLLESIAGQPPAVRVKVEAAARDLASGEPAVKAGILRDIEGAIEPRGADVTAVVRSFKPLAGRVPPLAKRFDNLRVGDVLLVRQPDDVTSLDFYKSGWIIIVDKALSVNLRARASHTFLFVKEVDGVKLFLDNMPGQGTRIKTEAQIAAEYSGLAMDVARPLSAVDAGRLWAAARETGIKSLKAFAARGDNWIDTTDYGPYGDDDMVCSETARWALVKAGMVVPETSSAIKDFVFGVDYGPADFYVDKTNFLITPLERLRAPREGGRP